jgi:DNA-binding transcriptional LysR family regulator
MEVDNVEVGLLRTFLAVVEHGSIGKTAVAVDKTQPAISQQMLRLEKIVRQRLFARGRNGIKLTRHGQLLAAYARRAIELNEEILLRLRGETAGRQMAVGMSADVALVGLAAAMKRFQSPHSDFELRVLVTAPNRLDALLRAGKRSLLDLPMCKGRIPPWQRSSPKASFRTEIASGQ